MSQIIDVEESEVRDWLERNPAWNFCGEVNTISRDRIVAFVNSLYDAGCESILISDYEWEIEPVYEGDEFHPNMLILRLPASKKKREIIFEILNASYSNLEAKMHYKDGGKKGMWYFFEPEAQKITVGGKQITWYS